MSDNNIEQLDPDEKITFSASGVKVETTRRENEIWVWLKAQAREMAAKFVKGDEEDPQKLREMAEKLRKS